MRCAAGLMMRWFSCRTKASVSQLAETYLDVKQFQVSLPLVIWRNVTIAPPAPSPTPPGFCVDAMALVSELTYPDYNLTTFTLLPPNTPFKKGWRIRNTGTCTWSTGYVLRYVNGNKPEAMMGGRQPRSRPACSPAETMIYISTWSPLPHPAFTRVPGP